MQCVLNALLIVNWKLFTHTVTQCRHWYVVQARWPQRRQQFWNPTVHAAWANSRRDKKPPTNGNQNVVVSRADPELPNLDRPIWRSQHWYARGELQFKHKKMITRCTRQATVVSVVVGGYTWPSLCDVAGQLSERAVSATNVGPVREWSPPQPLQNVWTHRLQAPQPSRRRCLVQRAVASTAPETSNCNPAAAECYQFSAFPSSFHHSSSEYRVCERVRRLVFNIYVFRLYIQLLKY